jgi:hypothetical protein
MDTPPPFCRFFENNRGSIYNDLFLSLRVFLMSNISRRPALIFKKRGICKEDIHQLISTWISFR